MPEVRAVLQAMQSGEFTRFDIFIDSICNRALTKSRPGGLAASTTVTCARPESRISSEHRYMVNPTNIIQTGGADPQSVSATRRAVLRLKGCGLTTQTQGNSVTVIVPQPDTSSETTVRRLVAELDAISDTGTTGAGSQGKRKVARRG